MKTIKENIHLSKDGISFSYYRFLTETSVGIITYLTVFFLLKFFYLNTTGYLKSFFLIFIEISTNVKIGVFLALVISSTAIGNVVSNISYFLLGFIELWFTKLILKYKSIFLKISWISYSANETIKYFDLEKNGILEFGYEIQRILEYYGHPKIKVNSNRTLMRNLSFLIILTTIILIGHVFWWQTLISVFVALIFMFVTSLNLAHQILINFYIGFRIVKKNNKTDEELNLKPLEIIEKRLNI